jgi:hypothetical protein
MNRRSDSLSASLVDAAIHAAAAQGLVSAAKRLVDAGISWEVVMRVLKRPADRRTYSRPAGGPIHEP